MGECLELKLSELKGTSEITESLVLKLTDCGLESRWVSSSNYAGRPCKMVCGMCTTPARGHTIYTHFVQWHKTPKGLKTTDLVQFLDFTHKTQKPQVSTPSDRVNYMSPSKAG